MPRTRVEQSSGVLDPTPPRSTPFVIDPNAVYLPGEVIAALGLRSSSLRTEWRHGRLRVVRRCGRNFLLGRDVLAWLDGGELKSRCEPRIGN
jgi:hypothetical protein